MTITDDGVETLTEARVCTKCGHDMTVTIINNDGYLPLHADVDEHFLTLGWRGFFCPPHAHLAR